MLRTWQDECITTALRKYQCDLTNFLAMATPGAGKTYMAAHLAKRLFELGKIDLVLCFTPSVTVTNSFQETLEFVTNKSMAGQLGSAGQVFTYHHLSFISTSFWEIFNNHRVFVIFDEIHHCSGQDIALANMWGEAILRHIRSRASYTLALSGTPWRSDKLPIALAQYSGNPSELQCDYIYPLSRAIADGVCRTPKVVAIDNDHIGYTQSGGEITSYKSIRDLLCHTEINYSDLLHNAPIVTFIIQQSINRLNGIRQHNPRAAGLIVASSVDHAYWLQDILAIQLNEPAIIVSYEEPESQRIIENFEEGDAKWIIAIGMVSEGTNIPRLQVCCYLSRVKTELYFRQVLGRIVRTRKESYPFAYLYVLAEETLLGYANRIGKDLPSDLAIVEMQQMDTASVIENHSQDNSEEESNASPNKGDISLGVIQDINVDGTSLVDESAPEAAMIGKGISLSGQFSEELILLQHAFNEAC